MNRNDKTTLGISRYFGKVFVQNRILDLGLQGCHKKRMSRAEYETKWDNPIKKCDLAKPNSIYPIFEELFLDTLLVNSDEVTDDIIKPFVDIIKVSQKCMYEFNELRNVLKTNMRVLAKKIRFQILIEHSIKL